MSVCFILYLAFCTLERYRSRTISNYNYRSLSQFSNLATGFAHLNLIGLIILTTLHMQNFIIKLIFLLGFFFFFFL